MATFTDYVESIKQTALSLERAALRLSQDPQNEVKVEQVADLIDSVYSDLDKLNEWIDAGCPAPAPEEK